MSENDTPTVPPPPVDEPTRVELTRFRAFLFIQVLFLCASPITGGFHFSIWTMLDTSFLVLSIGMSALAFVLETKAGRRRVFRLGAALYTLGVLDMAVNILISGAYGWKGITS
ncbi:MAG: hypothetical protein COA70_11560 [Planctomycetota bacterium]|nr:MAG: hypothetical protein COA70_11560 [Planctomycetota bacterium]